MILRQLRYQKPHDRNRDRPGHGRQHSQAGLGGTKESHEDVHKPEVQRRLECIVLQCYPAGMSQKAVVAVRSVTSSSIQRIFEGKQIEGRLRHKTPRRAQLRTTTRSTDRRSPESHFSRVTVRITGCRCGRVPRFSAAPVGRRGRRSARLTVRLESRGCLPACGEAMEPMLHPPRATPAYPLTGSRRAVHPAQACASRCLP